MYPATVSSAYTPSAFTLALQHTMPENCSPKEVDPTKPSSPDSFEARVSYLEYLNVEYGQEHEYRGEVPRQSFDLKVFKTITLPFTADEWCHLCMHEGEFYVGGCCGSMSMVQDEINSIFRDGGWITCEQLANIAESMASHDGGNDEYPFGALEGSLEDLVTKAQQNWDNIGPWNKMAVIWQVVRDHYAPEVPSAIPPHKSPLDAALGILSSSLYYFYLVPIFNGSYDSNRDRSQDRGTDLVNLYRLLPALKTLNEHIQELNPGPMEGVALIDKTNGPEAVAKNRRGYCIFETQEEADKLLNLWRRQQKEHEEDKEPPIDERIGVRKVRVSAEKGIEFLD